jgi:hypothetical protein
VIAVAHFLLGSVAVKSRSKSTLSHWMGCVSSGGDHPPSFSLGRNPRLAHQSGHPFARATHPLSTQVGVKAWTPISARVRGKHLSNLFRKLSIFSLASTGGTLAPGVKAAFRDEKSLAHHHNGKFLLVLINKLILHLDSREKMLTTFFNISRSCCTRSSSRLRRRFSSSSDV